MNFERLEERLKFSRKMPYDNIKSHKKPGLIYNNF